MSNNKYGTVYQAPDEDGQLEREQELAARAASAEVIHQHVTEIWGYVRNNALSLDSARCCAHITRVVERLVTSLRGRIEELTVEAHRARKQVAVRDKQLKSAKIALTKTKNDAPTSKVAPRKPSRSAAYVKSRVNPTNTAPPPGRDAVDHAPPPTHKDIL